ncbi:MAG: chemotaxis protein CheD [Rhodocyclaceae bacterium]
MSALLDLSRLPAGSPDVSAERQTIDIFLSPGEFFFGDEDTRIRTVLGSCVAITLWHPRRRIGGMCHYMLPSRGQGRSHQLDGRYCDEAIAMFLRETRGTRTLPGEYEVKVFGGGNMFPHRHHHLLDVGRRNAETGLDLLSRHGFHVKARHLAGSGHRNVVFELWSGDVWMRYTDAAGAHLGEK